MQIATIAPKPPVTNLVATANATPGNTGPIGVASYGTMRVGHALNGVVYTEHKLLGPMNAPMKEFTGSLQDAIAGAKQFLLSIELRADLQAPLAVALLGMGNKWVARTIFSEPTVIRAINTGPGTGGIASISFPSMSRSLGALVTSSGSLIPSQLRG